MSAMIAPIATIEVIVLPSLCHETYQYRVSLSSLLLS
jgi:hypothetical protein